MTILWVVLGLAILVAACAGVPALRRRLVTPWVMRQVSRALPPMSETERVALEAGTVWWDGVFAPGEAGGHRHVPAA